MARRASFPEAVVSACRRYLVSSDGTAYQNIVHCTYAQQVVGIHDKCILGNTFPYAKVAGFFPVHICQAGFRSGTIGMHDIAIFWVAS